VDKGRGLIVGALAIAVLLGISGFLSARLWARGEIDRVERQAEMLRAQRDSILAVTGLRDSLKLVLDASAIRLENETDLLRQQIGAIETARARAQLAVWELRTMNDTERRFAEAFPEFAPAMRATTVASAEGDSIHYLMFPTNFTRSFIIYRQNSDAFEAQRDSLLTLDAKNQEIIGLKDSIIVLTEANEQAYRLGYDSAFSVSQQLQAEYVKLLRQPRFGVNVPTLASLAGALGVGFAVGFVVK
jgi:hypothetical protein